MRAKFEHALRRLPSTARSRLLALYDDPRAIDAMPVHAFMDGLALPDDQAVR